jgi:hypothetical protein
MSLVLRSEIVARAFHRLRQRKVHTLFPGYLHLQQRAGVLGRLEDLQPEFLSFFKQFFEVRDHPLGSPFIKPFTEQRPSARNLWLNENVAGSYAPSSLRPNQPFRRVVDVVGRRYTLPPDHASRALKYLLYGEQLSVRDVAIFLYRDYGITTTSPTVQHMVDVFMYEFGYTRKAGESADQAFWTLFQDDTTHEGGVEWFVPA